MTIKQFGRGPPDSSLKREKSFESSSRVEPPRGLRRGLGNPALFGIVQGFVAASIYFSLGLVVTRALGLTWAVFLAGAVLF
ncbi:MAG: hypothetical protein ICV86_04655, partial [Microcoleus sp. T3-bin5]|nr:hypothetical protein [Microcoleus sp. T3-bin5]